jgi:hypothetical protein
MAFALADARDFERKRDVVDDGAPGNVDSSWNTMPNAGCVPDTVCPSTATAALETSGEAADDVEQRRLAAAGRSDQRDELALRDENETPSTASSESWPSPKRLTMSATVRIGAPAAAGGVVGVPGACGAMTGERTSTRGRSALLPRHDLDELGELLLRERLRP